jgi:hypothetical protein
MWLFCDDAGIHPASARQLKLEVFPGDNLSDEDISDWVSELIRVGLLIEYEVEQESQVKRYWQVTGWHHQKIDRPRYQYPTQNSTTPRRLLDDTSTTPRRHVDDTSTTPRSLTVPETTVPETKGTIPKARTKDRFSKPNPQEVEEYARSIDFTLEGGSFVDYYESRGWVVGKSPMRDWRAAVRTWKRHAQERQPKPKPDPFKMTLEEKKRYYLGGDS